MLCNKISIKGKIKHIIYFKDDLLKPENSFYRSFFMCYFV